MCWGGTSGELVFYSFRLHDVSGCGPRHGPRSRIIPSTDVHLFTVGHGHLEYSEATASNNPYIEREILALVLFFKVDSMI